MSYWKMVCLGCALFAAMAIAASAQTFTTLAYYAGGQASSLIQGRDGNLYGTSPNGTNGYGAVFKLTPSGTLTVLHNFCSRPNCADGVYPGPLLLATDGNFYAPSSGGGKTGGFCGNYGCGTIFKITAGGEFTVLHTFNGVDGNGPGGLIEGSDGNLYSVTGLGGPGKVCTYGCGTIFKMTPTGVVTTLHTFKVIDGYRPNGLVQGSDGFLYGTTNAGGKFSVLLCSSGCGTVFKITTDGAFTSLHSFDLTDGATPNAPLVQASDGNFYGTTFLGKNLGDGTIFRISPQGALKTVYQFQGIENWPFVGLALASDGNLYGTTFDGGCSIGSIYSISISGVWTDVYDSCQYGSYIDTVVQATSGKFYGVYDEGVGTYYSLDTGLTPFVAFVIPAGKVGYTVQILGQGLTGTTSVTFNGVATTKFSVVSDTYMTAVVPAGATTGAVVVATPAGNLTSNVSFRITR